MMKKDHNRTILIIMRMVILAVLAAAAGCAGHKMPGPVETVASVAPPSIAGPEEGSRLAMDSYKRATHRRPFCWRSRWGEQYPNTPWARRTSSYGQGVHCPGQGCRG